MNLFYFAALELGRPDAPNRHTLEMCARLAQRGHSIWLFVPFKRSPSTALHPNIQIVPVPVLYGCGLFLTTLSFYVAFPWWSWTHFVRFHPPVVYTRASFLDCVAIAPLRLFFRFTCVGELNGIHSLETRGGATRQRVIAWLERLSLRLYDRAIGVTPELRRWAIETGNLQPEHTAAIGNGVAVELFMPMPTSEARRVLGLEPDTRYLNFTGSLKPWHGVETLFRSLPIILTESSLDVRVLMVGVGPEKEQMVKLAQELGVAHIVRWIGRVPTEQVSTYINASDVCLAPFTPRRNIHTGISPVKVFEYMSCGRPFVTTRLGVEFDCEIEACQCGLLVPPNDPSALANAIVRLLQNPEESALLGRRGRQLAVERYSWDRIAERTEQFISSAGRSLADLRRGS